MEDTIYNDLIIRDFKKHPVITRPHPVFGEVVAETLHVTAKIVLQPPQAFDHPSTIHRRQAFEVLFGFRFEFDAEFHVAEFRLIELTSWRVNSWIMASCLRYV